MCYKEVRVFVLLIPAVLPPDDMYNKLLGGCDGQGDPAPSLGRL